MVAGLSPVKLHAERVSISLNFTLPLPRMGADGLESVAGLGCHDFS